MAAMREQVKRLLLEEIPVGTPPRGRTFTERNTRVRGTNPSVTSSDIVEYVVSRLKSDQGVHTPSTCAGGSGNSDGFHGLFAPHVCVGAFALVRALMLVSQTLEL